MVALLTEPDRRYNILAAFVRAVASWFGKAAIAFVSGEVLFPAPPDAAGNTAPLNPLDRVRRISAPIRNACSPRVQLSVSAKLYRGELSPLNVAAVLITLLPKAKLPAPGVNATG